jgi:hypothetical protein
MGEMKAKKGEHIISAMSYEDKEIKVENKNLKDRL